MVAGFQGIDANGDITTLGRGGSDTTAAAVAWGIGADAVSYTHLDVYKRQTLTSMIVTIL